MECINDLKVINTWIFMVKSDLEFLTKSYGESLPEAFKEATRGHTLDLGIVYDAKEKAIHYHVHGTEWDSYFRQNEYGAVELVIKAHGARIAEEKSRYSHSQLKKLRYLGKRQITQEGDDVVITFQLKRLPKTLGKNHPLFAEAFEYASRDGLRIARPKNDEDFNREYVRLASTKV